MGLHTHPNEPLVRKKSDRPFFALFLYVTFFWRLSLAQEITASSLFTPTTTTTTITTVVPTSTIAQAASTTTRATTTTAQTAPITTIVPSTTTAQAALTTTRATTATAQTAPITTVVATSTTRATTTTASTINTYDFSGVSQEVTSHSFLSNISCRSDYCPLFFVRVELFLLPRTAN